MAAPRSWIDALARLLTEARFGADFLRRHGWRLALAFLGLLLPLWGFGELAEEVHEDELFDFDVPILVLAQAMARDGFDRVFLFFSAIGYAWGVVPVQRLNAR